MHNYQLPGECNIKNLKCSFDTDNCNSAEIEKTHFCVENIYIFTFI